MMHLSLRNTTDRLSGAIAVLIDRLVGVAVGPEMRVSYAIAQAAKQARRHHPGRSKALSPAPPQMSERSAEW